MFEKLSNAVEKTEELAKNLKTSVIDHLPSLETVFQWYLSELKKEEDAFLRNPSSTSLAITNILDEVPGPILWSIHRHMIFFMKCHFLGSGELCVNHIHNVLNWLSNYCFRCHNISLREWFSALAHVKTEARNQRIVQHHKRLALSYTYPRISKLAIRLQITMSMVALKMFVKLTCRLKLNVMKCIFVVELLW